MAGKEYGPGQQPEEQRGPFALPTELAEFLRERDYAMVTEQSDQGAVYVVKVPGRELAALRGPVPIEVRHELHQHPLAPVIRTVVRIYDQSDRPLALESFINVADEAQWADFASLADQERLTFLFYDETLSHQLTKQVRNGAQAEMGRILTYADRINASIPADQYDFDRAKAGVMARTSMRPDEP